MTSKNLQDIVDTMYISHSSCFSASYPIRVFAAAGALVNSIPTVCGGYSSDVEDIAKETDICHQGGG
jgi:hypothetical protein